VQRRTVLPLILVLAATALLVVRYVLHAPGRASPQAGAPSANRLALGRNARVDGALSIDIHEAVELDGLTRGEILELRRREVERHPELISGPYSPAETVFGQIVDGKPWWGIAGQFFYGPGPQSTAGPAEESRFVMNPFLPVAAEFFGLSIWDSCCFEWDATRVSDDDLQRPDFPFYCQPESLTWHPAESRVEVTYRVSAFLQHLNQYLVTPLPESHAFFNLIALNARDWGFTYIAVDYEHSHQISHEPPSPAPMRIVHYLHAGGSCGFPGGCNNMSPATPQINDLSVARLPAEARVLLWRDDPGPAGAAPDLTETLRLE